MLKRLRQKWNKASAIKQRNDTGISGHKETHKGEAIEIDGYKDFLINQSKGNPKVAIDYNALFVRMVKKI